MPPPSLRKGRKHFLTRYTVKNRISNLYILLKSALKMQEMPFQRPKFQNGISNLYILLKSALKMQELPFQRPKFQNISGVAFPRTPYNCVVTMASPSLKSWLRHSWVRVTWQLIYSIRISSLFKVAEHVTATNVALKIDPGHIGFKSDCQGTRVATKYMCNWWDFSKSRENVNFMVR